MEFRDHLSYKAENDSVYSVMQQRDNENKPKRSTRCNGRTILIVSLIAILIIGLAVGLSAKFVFSETSADESTQERQAQSVWSAWGEWSSCDVSCGSGLETRTRICQAQTGDQAQCEGDAFMQQACHQSECPAQSAWSVWGEWSSCDVSCGSGLETRTRICQTQTGDQAQCEGDTFMEQACHQSECPAQSVWSAWGEWSSCDVSCGSGLETRTRICQTQTGDQTQCEGDAFMQQACHQSECPAQSVWSAWGEWSSCDVSCGSGLVTRTRICQTQTGDQAQCEGETSMQQACHQPECQAQSVWSEWGEWSSCDVSCGSGLETRTRICQTQTGDQAQCEGDAFMQQACHQSECPAQSVWSAWGEWSSCDVSCGSGLETRTRICQTQTGDQAQCEGDAFMQQACHQSECPGVPYWTNWENWSACDVTCGEGIQARYRYCVLPDARGQCIGESREIALCNSMECPAYGLWSGWSEWGPCSQSCGNGTQTRTRECQKQSINDRNCIGKSSMQTRCNTWTCPDCTRLCEFGNLNEACDRCVCESTNVTVRTLTINEKPLMDVGSYVTTAQNRILGSSNEGGFIILNDICNQTELLFRKEGFQETKVTISAPITLVRLPALEFPTLTTRPVSKYRLVGGGAKFCCSARAAPAITYYEWFKDGELTDDGLNTNQTELELFGLTTNATGKYKCRANSPIGSIMSDEAELIVKGNKDDFCQGTLEDSFIALPNDCIQEETNTNTFNAGACRPQACRNETLESEASCSDTLYSCCRPSDVEFVEVQCSRYMLSVSKVIACSCGSCSLSKLRISGVTRGKDSKSPLRYGQLSVNGESNSYTGSDGSFSFVVDSSPNRQSLTLKFQDLFYNEFHDTIKVLEIPAAATDDIYLSIKLIEKPIPFNISSGVENVLYGRRSDTSNSTSDAVTELIIPPDSFYYDDGTKHTGNVSVRFTYLLSNDFDEVETIPGVFQFINTDGESSLLETLGVFNIQFYDTNNKELTVSDPIDIALTSEEPIDDPETGASMTLWGLNEETGFWEVLPLIQTRRRKRRQSKLIIGQANAGNYYWRNCDIYWRANRCFFNPPIYTARNEQISAATLQLTYLFTRPRRNTVTARWTKHTYMYPTCVYIYCSGVSTFLQIEMVTSDGNSYLIPDTSSAYTITEDRRAVQIVMQNDNINFFTSMNQCKARSSSTSGILSFHQPGNDENIYTFNWFSIICSGCNTLEQIQTTNWKSWCRPVGLASTKACSVRIHVQNYASKSIRVNVISRMGDAVQNLRMDVVGVREVIPDENGIACIPYRCNTVIDGVSDNTNVHIYIESASARCSVDSVNSNIVHEIENNELTFTVTEDDFSEAGLYLKEHQRFNHIDYDCKDLQTIVKDHCSAESSALATFRCW